MARVRWIGPADQFVIGHPTADHDCDEAAMVVDTGLYEYDGATPVPDGAAPAPEQPTKRRTDAAPATTE